VPEASTAYGRKLSKRALTFVSTDGDYRLCPPSATPARRLSSPVQLCGQWPLLIEWRPGHQFLKLWAGRSAMRRIESFVNCLSEPILAILQNTSEIGSGAVTHGKISVF